MFARTYEFKRYNLAFICLMGKKEAVYQAIGVQNENGYLSVINFLLPQIEGLKQG